MNNPYDQFDAEAANPYDQFDAPAKKPKAKRSAVADVTGFMANINRGLGVGDELAAGANTLLKAAQDASGGRKGPGWGKRFQNELKAQRGIEDEFTAERPHTAALARGFGMAGQAVVPLGASATGGNALMQIGRGATAGAMGGYAGGLADRGDLSERVGAANKGALVGGALGGAISAVGVGRNALSEIATRRADPANAMARYAPQDPAQLRARADEMRAAGFESPALVDVVDESGRGVIRGTASRNIPARQATRDFAEGRALNLPDRMSRQARRVISDDPRTPQQITDDLTTRRSQLASEEYAGPYAEQIQLDMGMARSLQGAPGRSAMQRARMAAEARNDEAQMAEIDRLLDGDFFSPLSAGTVHRLQIAMGERAERAGVRGARDIRGGLVERTEGLRGGLEEVPGLSEANATYRDLSGQIEAVETGGGFLRQNSDEFAAATQGMSPDQNAVARAAARRDVERAAGENVSAAPGVARRIATATEQQARNRALLGDEGATQLQDAMATEARAVQNAADINPRTGSQTQLRTADAARISDRVQDVSAAAAAAAGHPLPAIQRVIQRLGINDQQAQAITELAIDPNRLDEAILALERRGATPQEAREVVQSLRVSAGAGVAAGGGASQEGRGPTAGIHRDGMIYWDDGSVTPE